MVKHTLNILWRLLQDFLGLFDYFVDTKQYKVKCILPWFTPWKYDFITEICIAVYNKIYMNLMKFNV